MVTAADNSSIRGFLRRQMMAGDGAIDGGMDDMSPGAANRPRAFDLRRPELEVHGDDAPAAPADGTDPKLIDAAPATRPADMTLVDVPADGLGE